MAAAMITLIKKFTYRGDPLEEWSNSYHLSAAPADRAGWVAAVVGLADEEQSCYTVESTIIRANVYNDSNNPATYVFDAVTDGFHLSGGLAAGTGHKFAGDQAATIGWETGLTGSTGKKIYLRKYFHGGVEDATVPDTLLASTVTIYSSFASWLLANPLAGSIYFADKNGRRPDGPGRVDPYSTTRTLKRRGKRPTP